MTICLVPCVGKKPATAAPAREQYTSGVVHPHEGVGRRDRLAVVHPLRASRPSTASRSLISDSGIGISPLNRRATIRLVPSEKISLSVGGVCLERKWT